MNEQEINELVRTVAQGVKVIWMPNNTHGKRIIRTRYVKDASSVCAYSADGVFISLKFADPMDFFIVNPMFNKIER